MARRGSAPQQTTRPPRRSSVVAVGTNTDESSEWNATIAYFLVVVFFFMIVCVGFHISFMPEMKDWNVKLNDTKIPVYTLIGIATSVVSALGFGKPYSPALVTIFGFFVNISVSWFFPGLLDWLEKSCLLAVVFVLLIEFFWKWWVRNQRANNDDA